MRNTSSLLLLCVFLIAAVTWPGSASGSPATPTVAIPESAEEQLGFYRDLFDGNEVQIRHLETHADDVGFNHWLLGAAKFQSEQFDEAADHFLNALQLGELEALLSLAETEFRARNWVESFAWAQIWVLENYTDEEIDRGDAFSSQGMFLLRQLLDRMDDDERERAERLTNEYIQRWLSDLPEPPFYCLPMGAHCEGWEVQHREQPFYPRRMRQRNLQGWVKAALLVGPGGEVEDVQVLFASREDFMRPTIRALRRWVFTPPGNHDGKSHKLFFQTIEYNLFPMR